jgi:hypothetical protein
MKRLVLPKQLFLLRVILHGFPPCIQTHKIALQLLRNLRCSLLLQVR